MSSGASPAQSGGYGRENRAARSVDAPPDSKVVAAATSEGRDGEEDGQEARQARAPWHFKVIAVGSVVYLGYRAYQGISWLAHHIH